MCPFSTATLTGGMFSSPQIRRPLIVPRLSLTDRTCPEQKVEKGEYAAEADGGSNSGAARQNQASLRK